MQPKNTGLRKIDDQDDQLQIKRSNQLMSSINNLSLNALKLWLISIAGIKWLNELKIEIDESGRLITKISSEKLRQYMPTTMKNPNYITNLKQYAEELTRNQVGVIGETKNTWITIGSFATRAEFNNNEFIIYHNIDVIDLIDPKERFCEYYFKNIWTLKSPHQIKMYDLGIQFIKIGKRRESLEYLRIYFNKNNQLKANKDFINIIIGSTIEAINLDTNTDIYMEFETIKTGRKITDIVFYMKYKKQQALEDIELQGNNLKEILKSIGVSIKKLDFIKNFPIEKVINAAKHTKTLVDTKKLTTTPERCLIWAIKNIEKVDMSANDMVDAYLNLLTIPQRSEVTTEFFNQLTDDEKNTYAPYRLKNNNDRLKNNNEIIKSALSDQFKQGLYKFIYNKKLKI